ncbi:UTRA domain-containing protein [Sphingomonas sp.]|jgi:GntR family histidine utilization transcriptional repressor|uniref:UTRA domain-containing protein n=1 Tax=Sphingomonas sp. TaxID=28214 RepID=UPI002E315432|nr:UTRA domain-containing protein [Sphingomonas sp.]HEX4695219.1 UTRA domain-containing protein [Sphingomonas sp.]
MTVEARIRQEIEARIYSGEWKPGHRIPFEHELVAAYGCSRATVSKALSSLSNAGLIERRRKAGSFVAHPQVHSAVLEVPDLAQVIAARGGDYRWSLMNRRVETVVADFPSPALRIDGLHLESGAPFALEQRLISLGAVPGAADESFAAEAPGTWLLQHVPWTSARHRIRATEADRAEARMLDLRPRTACLELLRTTWRNGAPVTRVRQLFPGDRFDLIAEFKPDA